MSSAKGNVLELLAQATLERAGYLVHRTQRSHYRMPGGGFGSRGNDVWGIYDLLGTKDGKPLKFVQVTTAGQATDHRRKIEKLAHHFNLDHCQIELWLWVGGRKCLDRSNRSHRYKRRQYFRRQRWLGLEWHDRTPDEDGWGDEDASTGVQQ